MSLLAARRELLLQVTAAGLVVAVVLGYYFQISRVDFWLVVASLIALALPASGKTGAKLRLTAPDWCVLLVVLYEAPSLLHSQYQANSVVFTGTILVSALLYVFVRLTVRSGPPVLLLTAALAGFGMYLSWVAVSSFAASVQRYARAGLAEVAPLRALLIVPPPPFVLGEWLTLLLLTLPFAWGISVFSWLRHRPVVKDAYGPPGAYIDTGDPRGRDIHGGGTALTDPFAAYQPLLPTLGCTRAYNQGVIDLGEVLTGFQEDNPNTKIPYLRN